MPASFPRNRPPRAGTCSACEWWEPAQAEAVGQGQLLSRSNYFLGGLGGEGGQQGQELTDIRQFSSVVQSGVWDGVDLVLRSAGAGEGDRRFEFDFRAQPGADLSRIVLAAEG